VLKKFIVVFVLLFNIAFASEKGFKVYDCFTFFNEIEILKIRLHELYDKVDHFIIVESDRDFNGKSKPLHYKENQDLFAKFADKIIYIPLKNLKGDNILEKQRYAFFLGLKNAKDSDIVFLSDVDEFVSQNKITKIIGPLSKDANAIVRAELRSYKWFFNRWDAKQPFVNSFVALKYSSLKNQNPHLIKITENPTDHLIRDAGWHFTHMGFVETTTPKLKALNESVNFLYSKNAKMIILEARDCILSPVDESYPKFVQENIVYYKQHNFIDDDLRKDKTIKMMKSRERANKTNKHFMKK